MGLTDAREIAEGLVHPLQVVQRARTDVRAVGETEEQQRPLAAQALQRKRPAGLVDEIEIRQHPRLGKHFERRKFGRGCLVLQTPDAEPGRRADQCHHDGGQNKADVWP